MTTPPGARVRAGGRYYGLTPLVASLPCGPVEISLSYRRYKTVEKKMTLRAEKPVEMKLALERPRHQIKIVSQPGGATVSLNGRRVGKTPLSLTVPGYSRLEVEMRRAGFRTLRTTHYSKRSGEVVALRLEKSD